MFFIMGINDSRRDFDFSQMIICDACSAYGRYRVYMTCTVLSIFFIPLFKWNRRYFVETGCCNTVYALDSDIGAAIARGEPVEIRPEHLQRIQSRNYDVKRCSNCGYMTRENFDFCPKCGRKF